MLREPPVSPGIEVLGADAGCPVEACFRFEEAKKLVRHLEDLQLYSKEAWARCGKLDAGN